MLHLAVFGNAQQLNTYVATEHDKPVAIFVFRMQGSRALVLNHVISISQGDIERFARALFDRFRSISLIAFQTVQTDVRQLHYPHQRCNISENIVLTLPRTADEYVASLGKNTRKNVKYYLNRVKRSFPSFEYRLYERDQVAESVVLDVLRLKNTRLAGKGNDAIDDAEIRRTLMLVRARGMVGVITIDGKICAGSIGYRVGANSFGGVLAHDLAYDGYWIGMLCCFLTICESITLGCKEYHFLWGRDEYKFRMLGVQRDLDNLNVYRSRGHIMLNAPAALNTVALGYSRWARLWLKAAKEPDGTIGRLLARAVRLRPALGKGKPKT